MAIDMDAEKTALCLIATGKYQQYVAPMLASADVHFLPERQVEYFLFSDNLTDSTKTDFGRLINATCIEHKPWPYPTLHRYHVMLQVKDRLAAFDYVYYIDVDMLFVRPVGEEIFGDLVATIHPGYCQSPRSAFTYEYRRNSRAFVPWNEGTRYYAGAFQGGRAERWIEVMEHLAAAIDDDSNRGVIAWWHDESHWNRYLIDNPPTVELPHEYCCPDGWRKDTQKIIIIGKNAAEMRA